MISFKKLFDTFICIYRGESTFRLQDSASFLIYGNVITAIQIQYGPAITFILNITTIYII